MKKIRKKMLKALAKFNNNGSAFVDIAVKIGVGGVVGSFVISFFEANVDKVLGALLTEIEQVLGITIAS
jgi:hypothetical protein